MDIRIAFNGRTMSGDLTLDALAGLETDAGLATAVIVSLFTDARAPADLELPEGADRRGWWGDALPPEVAGRTVAGDRIGSLLWTVQREKTTPEVLSRVRSIIEQALAWMVTDGLARGVDVETWRDGLDRLGWSVVIHKPDGNRDEMRFETLWEAHRNAL